MNNNKKVKFSATGLQPLQKRRADLKEIIKLLEEGTVKTIIDACYQ